MSDDYNAMLGITKPQQDAPYGVVGQSPGMNDMRTAMQGDYQNQSEQDAFVNSGRTGSLEDFKGAVIDATGYARSGIQSSTQQGWAQMMQSLSQMRGDTSQAMASGNARINAGLSEVGDAKTAALNGIQSGFGFAQQQAQGAMEALQRSQNLLDEQIGKMDSSLGTAEGALNTQIDRAWASGQQALADFRSTVADQMTQWGTGFMEQQRNSKNELAKQLAAQGYRPEEIEAELRKSDRQAAQTQSQQFATFNIQEEQARRSLQLEYTKSAQSSEAAANQVRGQLRGIEAQFRSSAAATGSDIAGKMASVKQWIGDAGMKAGEDTASINQWASDRGNAMRQLGVQMDQWGADSDRTAEMAAMDYGSKLMIQQSQSAIAASQLELQGYNGLASLWQGTSLANTPFAPYLMQMLGMQMSLEDRQFGSEGAGLSLMLAGLSTLNGESNQLMGMARGSS